MVGRRYELKYSSWPYRLYALCSEAYSAAEKATIAQEALSSPRCCRDTFTHGICLRFPTVERLMSKDASTAMAVAFDNLRLATDLSERMNAEITAAKPLRGNARDFSHFSRETLLKQARIVHMQRGGGDPLRPSSLAAALEPCAASVMPLLLEEVIGESGWGRMC